jgi:hypothetical protein
MSCRLAHELEMESWLQRRGVEVVIAHVHPQHEASFGKLALRLARHSAPIVPYGYGVTEEFFSPRIGCQTYASYLYVDLAALCVRRQHR